MIKIRVNDKIYGFNRERVEDLILSMVVEKLNDPNLDKETKLKIDMIKGVLPMLGIHKPAEFADLDIFEYLIAHYSQGILDSIEAKDWVLQPDSVQDVK